MAALMLDKNMPLGTLLVQSQRGKGEKGKETELKILGNVLDT